MLREVPTSNYGSPTKQPVDLVSTPLSARITSDPAVSSGAPAASRWLGCYVPGAQTCQRGWYRSRALRRKNQPEWLKRSQEHLPATFRKYKGALSLHAGSGGSSPQLLRHQMSGCPAFGGSRVALARCAWRDCAFHLCLQIDQSR